MRHVESRKGRSGFTLIELLVVVAIIALLISILLPSLARARELAKRTACAANMSGMGKGLHTYANDGNQGMPISAYSTVGMAADGKTGAVTYVRAIGSKRGMYNDPSWGEIKYPDTTVAGHDNGKLISTVRNLWTLVRSGGSTPASFICPSCDDAKNDEDSPQAYWDFGKGDNTTEAIPGGPVAQAPDKNWAQISYGYQVPYGMYGKPSGEGDQRMVLAADKGPFGAIADGLKAQDSQFANWWNGLLVTSSPDDWRKFNSPNHGGQNDGDGQNVLFADSHAEWTNKPLAGPALDNIYTQWATPTGVGPNDRAKGFAPGSTTTAPFGGPTLTPYANTDGLIYP
jgi:prepilin-type N-terminal cleavage/methylation domain-containing protein